MWKRWRRARRTNNKHRPRDDGRDRRRCARDPASHDPYRIPCPLSSSASPRIIDGKRPADQTASEVMGAVGGLLIAAVAHLSHAPRGLCLNLGVSFLTGLLLGVGVCDQLRSRSWA